MSEGRSEGERVRVGVSESGSEGGVSESGSE